MTTESDDDIIWDEPTGDGLPDDPIDLFSQGWDYMVSKDLVMAEKFWTKGARFMGPDPFDQVMNCMDCLGVLLANQDRLDEAEFWWKESVRRFRNSDSQRHLDQLKREREE